MALTSLNLVQQLSANLTSTGIRGNIPLGGTNTTVLSSDDADYMYEFTIEAAANGNVTTWNLATNQLTNTTGSAYINQPSGAIARDANGDEVHLPDGQSPSVDDKIVAIYYETEATNTGNIAIAASNPVYGTVTFNSGVGTTVGVRVPRSALFIPRWEASSGTVTFTFSASGDKLHGIFLGKT